MINNLVMNLSLDGYCVPIVLGEEYIFYISESEVAESKEFYAKIIGGVVTERFNYILFETDAGYVKIFPFNINKFGFKNGFYRLHCYGYEMTAL